MAKVKKETVGYIVEPVGHRPMQMVEDDRVADDGLYFGSVVTVFTTRARASRAIRITMNRSPNFESRFGDLRITRLVAEN